MCLIVYPPPVGRATLSNDANVVDGNGIVITAGQGPVKLFLEEDGDVIRKEWYVVYANTTFPIGFIEVLH